MESFYFSRNAAWAFRPRAQFNRINYKVAPEGCVTGGLVYKIK